MLWMIHVVLKNIHAFWFLLVITDKGFCCYNSHNNLWLPGSLCCYLLTELANRFSWKNEEIMLLLEYRNLTANPSLASQHFPRDQEGVGAVSLLSDCNQLGAWSLVTFSKNFHEHRFTDHVAHEINKLYFLVRLTIINRLFLQNVSL